MSKKRDALELAEYEKDELEKQFQPVMEVEDSDFSLANAVSEQRAEEKTAVEDEGEHTEDEIKEVIESRDIESFDRMLDEDFEVSRQNIMKILNKHDEIMDVLLAVARESESPRAFEVLNNTLTHMIESNKQVMDLYEKRENVKEKRRKNLGMTSGKNDKQQGGFYQQNNYYEASTSDMLDEAMREEKTVN